MPLHLVRNDIIKMKVDAIVNAANPSLNMGGGVCGAIFRAAGPSELQEACNEIGGCSIGEAVITNGFNLKAQYIIHTAGPIWQGGSQQEAELLKASYYNSLELAKKYQCESIAFPLISSGIYGYPKKEAIHIAISTISSFLLQDDMLVYLVIFDRNALTISQKLFTSIHEYIDEHYVDEIERTFSRNRNEEQHIIEQMQEADLRKQDVVEEDVNDSLVNLLNQLDESFAERLFRYIDERQMTDVAVYKAANLDRRLFSKIRNNTHYTPKKKTVLAFAIALKLDLHETLNLLETTGFTLSHSSKFDIIIEYFIKQANYNINEINQVLFAFDQPILGA